MANSTNTNTNLHSAKNAKRDEFYTQLTDIENELKNYRKHFKGATVLCNCDDPYESNFFKYFVLNFNRLKLKKVIATCYATSPIMGRQLSLFDLIEDVEVGTPYKAVVTSVYDATGDGAIDMDDIAELFRLGENEISVLEGNGDFRSEECLALMDEADIVVTNPPFSLFGDYMAELLKRDKKFLIIGNKNALTFKEIFPLIKENRMWVGATPMSREIYFDVPEDYIKEGLENGKDRTIVFKNDRYMARSSSIWYTNLDHKKRHDELICVRRYRGNEENYPHYDNYDAINVNKVVDLPLDYQGVIGVPISFMDKFCPEQFEIVDGRDIAKSEKQRNKTTMLLKDKDSAISGKPTYARICIRYTDEWIQSHPEDFKETS